MSKSKWDNIFDRIRALEAELAEKANTRSAKTQIAALKKTGSKVTLLEGDEIEVNGIIFKVVSIEDE